MGEVNGREDFFLAVVWFRVGESRGEQRAGSRDISVDCAPSAGTGDAAASAALSLFHVDIDCNLAPHFFYSESMYNMCIPICVPVSAILTRKQFSRS